jgi:hypothetical protein
MAGRTDSAWKKIEYEPEKIVMLRSWLQSNFAERK